MNEQTRDLIETALETYRAEILPTLPTEKRYAGAMIANAIAIAGRAVIHDDPAAALLAMVYGTEPATLAKLARDIRVGQVSEASHPALTAWLLRAVQAELEITNPKFLERGR